jgi:hypothetical protein
MNWQGDVKPAAFLAEPEICACSHASALWQPGLKKIDKRALKLKRDSKTKEKEEKRK